MLGDNIRILRKQKGYSQETLAEKLNVVRQTISKWEKSLSTPDAELLQAMSELFEVSVSDLLGEKIPDDENVSQENEVAKQLAILNDRLANQKHQTKENHSNKCYRGCGGNFSSHCYLYLCYMGI